MFTAIFSPCPARIEQNLRFSEVISHPPVSHKSFKQLFKAAGIKGDKNRTPVGAVHGLFTGKQLFYKRCHLLWGHGLPTPDRPMTGHGGQGIFEPVVFKARTVGLADFLHHFHHHGPHIFVFHQHRHGFITNDVPPKGSTLMPKPASSDIMDSRTTDSLWFNSRTSGTARDWLWTSIRLYRFKSCSKTIRSWAACWSTSIRWFSFSTTM